MRSSFSRSTRRRAATSPATTSEADTGRRRTFDPSAFAAALELFPRTRHLELLGEGEPLLHPRLFELASSARSRGLEISIFTNGSLLDDRNVERILDLGFLKVVVSVDTADPSAFPTVRGGGELARVVEGLARLARRRCERGLSQPPIGLSATLLRRAVGHLPGIVALYRSLALDGGIGYQPLNLMDCYAQGYPETLRRQAISLGQLDAHVRQLSCDPEVREALRGTSPHRGFFDLLFEGVEAGSGRCPWLERGAYVTARGHLSPCCMIEQAPAFGRLGESAASFGGQRERTRQALAEGSIPPLCRGCELASLSSPPPGPGSQTRSSTKPTGSGATSGPRSRPLPERARRPRSSSLAARSRSPAPRSWPPSSRRREPRWTPCGAPGAGR